MQNGGRRKKESWWSWWLQSRYSLVTIGIVIGMIFGSSTYNLSYDVLRACVVESISREIHCIERDRAEKLVLSRAFAVMATVEGGLEIPGGEEILTAWSSRERAELWRRAVSTNRLAYLPADNEPAMTVKTALATITVFAQEITGDPVP